MPIDNRQIMKEGIKAWKDINLDIGPWRVAWDYCGEGASGDYDPEDPLDEALLRFSCSKLAADIGDYEPVEDGSYVTNMTVATSPFKLVACAMAIIEILKNNPRPKKELEQMSWIAPHDFSVKQRFMLHDNSDSQMVEM